MNIKNMSPNKPITLLLLVHPNFLILQTNVETDAIIAVIDNIHKKLVFSKPLYLLRKKAKYVSSKLKRYTK
jgi:hypothetical protein